MSCKCEEASSSLQISQSRLTALLVSKTKHIPDELLLVGCLPGNGWKFQLTLVRISCQWNASREPVNESYWLVKPHFLYSICHKSTSFSFSKYFFKIVHICNMKNMRAEEPQISSLMPELVVLQLKVIEIK